MSINWQDYHLKANDSLWQGRNDGPARERFHQIVCLLDPSSIPREIDRFILGFASDEGVRRNKGRLGAFQGPEALRKALGGLSSYPNSADLGDLGDIFCKDGDLEKSQQALGLLIAKLTAKKMHKKPKLLVIGGGHETAFGHYLGWKGYLKQEGKKLGIINVDAHFDLRKVDKPTSGTPFLQILEDAKKEEIFCRYMVLGIQPASNTATLFTTASNWGVSYIEAQAIFRLQLAELATRIAEFISSVDEIYLSICLDAFAMGFAPGVSAPSALGLLPQHVHFIIEEVKKTEKLMTADIVELAPALDERLLTQKLAAGLAAAILA